MYVATLFYQMLTLYFTFYDNIFIKTSLTRLQDCLANRPPLGSELQNIFSLISRNVAINIPYLISGVQSLSLNYQRGGDLVKH